AGLQLFARQAPVHVALDVERGHARVLGVVEPRLAAQAPVLGHVALFHGVSWPPLISITWPVMYPLIAGSARKSTVPTHSSGVPARPIGMPATIAAICSSDVFRSWNGVVMMPGAMAFTRIPVRATSLARPRVKVLTAPFAVA